VAGHRTASLNTGQGNVKFYKWPSVLHEETPDKAEDVGTMIEARPHAVCANEFQRVRTQERPRIRSAGGGCALNSELDSRPSLGESFETVRGVIGAVYPMSFANLDWPCKVDVDVEEKEEP
jgi:hypothetical protein